MTTVNYSIELTPKMHAALGDTMQALLSGREITPEKTSALRVAQKLFEEVEACG